MESDLVSVLLQLAQSNAEHIAVLNDDYTALSASVAALEAKMETVQWFIGVNVVAWIGLMVSAFGKKLFRNGKQNGGNDGG